ncbi:TPA: hypothetical protein TVR18_000832 [Streptococcus equi subsp. zooepidemicus]|nr:hypothetical protein [Streptococcus equi subsp. zooepidemicus]
MSQRQQEIKRVNYSVRTEHHTKNKTIAFKQAFLPHLSLQVQNEPPERQARRLALMRMLSEAKSFCLLHWRVIG